MPKRLPDSPTLRHDLAHFPVPVLAAKYGVSQSCLWAWRRRMGIQRSKAIGGTHQPRLGYTPLPYRILRALATAGTPLHTRALAARLRVAESPVATTCRRMAADGRLRWVALGTYALAREAQP